jgi:hypothetical protein
VILNVIRPRSRGLPSPTPPLGNPAKAVFPHQASNAVAAAALAAVTQLFPHSWAPENPIAFCMKHANLRQQPPVRSLATARGAIPPTVVAARRNPQATAHQTNGKGIAATIDHAALHFDSFAKNVAASRKKSHSFFTRASSRLSEAISSSRGLP